MALSDQTPITWEDGVTALSDANLNTEIRNAYSLLLNPPTCQVHSTRVDAVPRAAWTVVTWDTLVYDTDPTMWTSASATRVTVNTPGWYFVNAAAGISVDSDTGLLVGSLAARVNGSAMYNLGSCRVAGNIHLYTTGSTLIRLAQNDYLELLVFHNSGSYDGVMAIQSYMPLFTVLRWRGL